jgi:hypothetical protein
VRFQDIPPDPERLDPLSPDVLIFDLAATDPSFAIALLEKHPKMLLLGVDLKTGRMLVFSSQPSDALTTDELVNVIENYSAVLSRARVPKEVSLRGKPTKNLAFNVEWKSLTLMFSEEIQKMKSLLEKWASLSKRNRMLVSVVGVVVLLLIVGALFILPEGSPLAEFQTALSGADYSTIHFYPSQVCIGVGDKMQAKMFGWGWDAAKWGSDNSDIATASGDGEVTGVKVGTTHMNLKGSAGVITMKELPVTVKANTADCASFYMPNVDLTPPQYSASATSFKFVFVSDTQGCPGCSAAEGPDLVDHDFAIWFADKMLEENPAFIVNGGDLAGLGGINKNYEQQWLNDIAKVWKTGSVPAGKTSIPIYAIVGNHDLTRDTLGAYYKTKQESWQNDLWPWYVSNGGKPWPTNVSNDYKYLTYSFAYGNSVFVFTDSYYMWGSMGNDTSWLGNMMRQEAYLPQIAYVEKEIQWASANSKPHIFVFGHSPVFEKTEVNNQLLKKVIVNSGLSGGYLGGHSGGLYQTVANSKIAQFIAETGGGDKNPNSYLRVEVNGNAWTVTAVFRNHNGTVTEGSTTTNPPTKWSYPQ